MPIPAPPRARTATTTLATFGASFMLVPFIGCMVLTPVSLHLGPCDDRESNLRGLTSARGVRRHRNQRGPGHYNPPSRPAKSARPAGLLQQIPSLRLELIHLHMVA